MKRQLFGVLAGVLTASAFLAAQGTQNPPPQNAAPAQAMASADVTVTGCLTQGSSPTIFVLDNAKQKVDDKNEKAQRYLVVAASEDLPLAANLNHEVNVMGSPDAKVATAGAPEKDLPRFSAKTVTSIADRCTSTR
jgi:hypothetical protein